MAEDDYKYLMFDDHLVTVSDTGKELGEFTISVEPTRYKQTDCFLIHANSHGSIDGVPCGTSITAYVAQNLETIEQQHHEYVKVGTCIVIQVFVVDYESNHLAMNYPKILITSEAINLSDEAVHTSFLILYFSSNTCFSQILRKKIEKLFYKFNCRSQNNIRRPYEAKLRYFYDWDDKLKQYLSTGFLCKICIKVKLDLKFHKTSIKTSDHNSWFPRPNNKNTLSEKMCLELQITYNSKIYICHISAGKLSIR